jgi:predicted transcriptional regulator
MLARRLVGRYGLTQMEVASMLGVSQPSINYYLTSKRGRIKDKKSVEELERLADELAEKMARGIIRSEEIFIEFCKICSRSYRAKKEYDLSSRAQCDD